MSSLRSGPTREFRPTRSTRSTARAASTSATAAASGTESTARSRSTSRPPSGIATNGRPGSNASSIAASRPGSSAGPTSGVTRAGLGNNANRASAPAPSMTTATGIKRKTRSTSSNVETQQDLKRPVLSSSFSTHVSQTSLNRQLLDAQAQITKVENTVQDKQREITRLEADLVLVATREEEERNARTRSEDELARKTSQYEIELSSLRRKLAELEADHEDLNDAYSNFSHTTQSQISSLHLELTSSNERIRLLEIQLNEAETNAREQEIRAKALEELLEQVTEEGGDGDEGEEGEEGETEKERSASLEKKSSRDDKAEQKQEVIEFKEPESSVADSASVQGEAESDGDNVDIDADVDADGDAEDEEESMEVEAVEGDVTPTREVEASSARSASPAGSNIFYEGGQPEPYLDPGAPPPYTVSPAPGSPTSASSGLRSRSASIASMRNGSIASSSMSITYDGPPLPHVSLHSTESSISIASNSQLDPLSHIRRRLSFVTPGRRRSSVVSRDRGREKDNEIIRVELARQTSHITSLESTNARLTSEIARLRDRAQGTELLREEKRELERRIRAMESLRARAAELEAAVDESTKRERDLQAKLKQQEHINSENADPVGVIKELATLRKAHAAILDEHGELKAELRANEVELAEAREEVERTLSEAQRLKDQLEHLQRAIARKEKERTLLENDVTFLRSLVSSYKNEEAADMSMETGEEPHHPETEKLERRVAQLESLLVEYKRTILSLEQEVDRLRLRRTGSAVTNKSQDEWNQLLEKASKLEEAFKNAQTESVKHAERTEELEQRIFELGGEIGGGRHIPPGTRVLSMRQNPAQEWADTRQAVLDRLRAENEALLARLKDLEGQGRGVPAAPQSESDRPNYENSHLVPRISWETVKKEKEELEAALSQRQKRLDRLQEIYSKKSREFREAIESILGVKLAFYPNGQVRVTSIYDLSATFVFQPSNSADKGGTKLQLVATGDRTPPELDGLMNMWLRDEMCIPCFMSSVTLECYDKWKIEQREAGLLNV